MFSYLTDIRWFLNGRMKLEQMRNFLGESRW